MKKLILLLIIVTAFASCKKSETPEPKPEPKISIYTKWYYKATVRTDSIPGSTVTKNTITHNGSDYILFNKDGHTGEYQTTDQNNKTVLRVMEYIFLAERENIEKPLFIWIDYPAGKIMYEVKEITLTTLRMAYQTYNSASNQITTIETTFVKN